MGAPVVSPAGCTGPARSRGGLLAGLSAVVLVGLLSGCGSSTPPDLPTPSATSTPPIPGPSPSPSGSPAPAPVPPDGVTLAQLGLEHGPATFSLPRNALVDSVVDQANNVVLVLRTPPAEIAGYLRRTLPGAGFELSDADPADSTFTFEGQGWRGSFTTGDGASAILLRPR